MGVDMACGKSGCIGFILAVVRFLDMGCRGEVWRGGKDGAGDGRYSLYRENGGRVD